LQLFHSDGEHKGRTKEQDGRRERDCLNSFTSANLKKRIFAKSVVLNEKVKYWIDLSDYDLETAEAMLVSGRYLYVGFMCHQSIEKILKAYFSSKSSETPPYSHNLTMLSDKSGINDLLENDFKEFLNILEPLNIEARYPTHKQQLLKSLTENRCKEILLTTKILQKWVKEKL